MSPQTRIMGHKEGEVRETTFRGYRVRTRLLVLEDGAERRAAVVRVLAQAHVRRAAEERRRP